MTYYLRTTGISLNEIYTEKITNSQFILRVSHYLKCKHVQTKYLVKKENTGNTQDPEESGEKTRKLSDKRFQGQGCYST